MQNRISNIFGRIINRAASLIAAAVGGVSRKNAAEDISRSAICSGVIDRTSSAAGGIVRKSSSLDGKPASVIDKAAAIIGACCRLIPGEGTAFDGRVRVIAQINRAAVARCRTVCYVRIFNGERPVVHVDRAAPANVFHTVLHSAVFYVQRSINLEHGVVRRNVFSVHGGAVQREADAAAYVKIRRFVSSGDGSAAGDGNFIVYDYLSVYRQRRAAFDTDVVRYGLGLPRGIGGYYSFLTRRKGCDTACRQHGKHHA